MARKIILGLSIIFLLISFFSPGLVRAQAVPTQVPPSSLEKFQQSLESCAGGSMSLDCWIGGAEQVDPNAPSGVMPAITNSLTTMIIGPMPTPGATSYKPGGAVGGIGSFVAALYANPPASSVEYFADLGQNLGILAKPAYAQGIGFEGLKPLLPVWKAFRNIAYIFFVIIFVVMGFAIMFRVKLDPQTAISIQTAIPRVVVALLLVTFSYAIAGLLIDLIYLGIGLIIGLMAAGGLFTPAEAGSLQTQFLTGGFPQVIGAAFRASGNILPIALIGGIIGAAVGGLIGSAAAGLGAVPGAVIGGLVGGGLIVLILSIIILFVLLKLFLELLKTYINIILAIILGPLQIMLGVLPGVNGFSTWFKNLFANVMVFPAVAAFLLITRVLMNKMTTGGDLWTPPMLGMPLLMANVVPPLIALGFLLILHKVPEMVREALGVKPLPFGGIGEAFGPIQGAIGFGKGLAGQAVREGITQTVGPRFYPASYRQPPAGGPQVGGPGAPGGAPVP